MSFNKVKSKINFKNETFKHGKDVVTKLVFRGKTLCLYLALNPADYQDTKYKIEDMSGVSNGNVVPTMYRINLPRRANYAKELIFEVNETVTLEEIKKRVPGINKKATYYKVLSSGSLDKPLIVDADDFSIEAKKIIVLTGGKVLVSRSK